METSKMYISESPSNNGGGSIMEPLHHHNSSPTKYASTSSIPSLIESSYEASPMVKALNKPPSPANTNPAATPVVYRDKDRRHSVLDSLFQKARRDSFFQKARRHSIFEDKENKEKRRGSEGTPGRRGSVFYVSSDLTEETTPPSSPPVDQDGKDISVDNNKSEESLGSPQDSLQEMAAIKKGRRKSWHPLGKPPKLDRKRRKGVADAPSTEEVVGSTENILYTRQKRTSWWNIFADPSRSRRMSQDVATTRSTENLTSFFRSKSRSVDHGFTAPFDLDSLRNKVEGRFESISRDSDESKDSSGSQEKKSGGRLSQPINTIAYTVGDRDTLTSVAARFDTTPSELSKLNRLGISNFIYAGQQLWVPAKGEGAPRSGSASGVSDSGDPDRPLSGEAQDDLPIEERELLNNLRPVSPKPGHLERVKTPLGSANAMDEDVQPYKERFLKITVRHITDGQGVVGGVLLVTPNAVMFDPNVSDPLVIEHGPESYGVIAPMEFIVNSAIYYDIAHMRVGHTETSQPEKKPEIYYMKKPTSSSSSMRSAVPETIEESAAESRKSCSPGKDETFPELTVDDSESVCSCAEREGDAFPKAFDKDLITPTNTSSDEASTKEKETENETEKEEETSTKEEIGGGQASRTLEERRRSMLDHHWAVPSKDRLSFSVDDEQQDSLNSEKAESSKSNAIPEDEESSLVKQSCHDSGIDIRDPNPPLPVVQPIPAKKVYSDADIVLSSDWVPPITIAPTNVTTSTLDADSSINGRKKASSVSFSLDSNNEELQEKEEEHKEDDKQETRKNKMLKRLSYPLSWMEGLTGDSKDEDSKPPSDKMSSLPNSADSHHSSVFSKVFSSSPINLVSDFSSGLFAKTPSEESSGKAGGTPPLTASSLSQDSLPVFSPGFMGRSSVGGFNRTQPLNSSGSSSIDSSRGSKTSTAPPRLDYRSMVSVEDMPELFVSFDKLIPRPARSCEDPPLYLRLRTGRPKDKKIPWSTPIMSYGKKKIRPEYWFSIPRNRVDDLYRFIHAWVPSLYGELDEDMWRERGYILSDTDTDLSPELTPREAGEAGGEEGKDAEEGKPGEISELTRESWELIKAPYVKLYSILKTSSTSADYSLEIQDPEVLSMSEELRRALYANSAISLDAEIAIPDLVGTTEILSEDHRESLCRHLPARAEGYLWTLVFSTSQHGFSLNSMYRKMAKIESPILLVIEDTEGNVFGALTSCSLRVSDHFYGTGESLLFRFTPRFQAFNWTGDNVYFIKGNNESLAIGAGDGKFGLWLDGDLYQGRTQSCSTYGNEPLAPHEDFVVKTLECWAFI